MNPDVALGLGIGVGLGGLVCLGCCVAIAVPNFVEMKLRATRAEVPNNVDGIRTGEMAYDAVFDQFLPCDLHPRPVESLDRDPVTWGSSPDFEELGWAPDGQTRGSYSVEVIPGTADGKTTGDFVVHGWIDADGDGVPAHYTATKSLGATLVTASDTY